MVSNATATKAINAVINSSDDVARARAALTPLKAGTPAYNTALKTLETAALNYQKASLVLESIVPRMAMTSAQLAQLQRVTEVHATMISLGTNMWNAICTVEELGLNSCCLRAYNTDKISNIVSLSSKEEMPEGWKWEPFIFLCVGKGKKLKGDHRKYKPKGIVNSLTFEV